MDKVNFGDELVTREEKTRRVGGVFTSVAGNYDLMNDLMSGGMHRIWKNRFVAKVKPRHGEAIGDLHGEALYHASLDPAEYRALLAANGFAVIEECMEDSDCGGHSVWLARRGEDR